MWRVFPKNATQPFLSVGLFDTEEELKKFTEAHNVPWWTYNNVQEFAKDSLVRLISPEEYLSKYHESN